MLGLSALFESSLGHQSVVATLDNKDHLSITYQRATPLLDQHTRSVITKKVSTQTHRQCIGCLQARNSTQQDLVPHGGPNVSVATFA